MLISMVRDHNSTTAILPNPFVFPCTLHSKADGNVGRSGLRTEKPVFLALSNPLAKIVGPKAGSVISGTDPRMGFKTMN